MNLKTIKISLTLVLSILITSTFAQNADYYQIPNQDQPNLTPPFFIGVGTGINDIGLVGVAAEFTMNKSLSANVGLGIGGWGYKVRVGTNYYFIESGFKSSLGVAFSRSSGLVGFETEMETAPNDQMTDLTLNLKPANTFDLIYSYNAKIGKASKIVLSAGYSIAITTNAYELDDPSLSLNETSKLMMDILQPGGILLGVKIMFGVM